MSDPLEKARNLVHSTEVETLLSLTLSEDLGEGDVTTLATVPADARGRAHIEARQDGIVCGFPVVDRLIELAGADIELTVDVADGERIQKGAIMARLRGSARDLMTLERSILNLLQRLSGIATITRRHVDAVAHTRTVILETRKTIPGWRRLDKYGVLTGGGRNHRMGLFDQILAKENHFALIPAADFPSRLEWLKSHAPSDIVIQVEVEDLSQLRDALDAAIPLILLDNMSVEDMAQAVHLRDDLHPATQLEASGGITLETVASVAEVGVDRISIGALTHSVPAFDLSLLVD